MIGYIKGKVDDILADSVLIENNGVGFQIFTSQMAIEQLLSMNGEVKMLTYMHVREDEISLFGFPTRDELNMFKMLLTVNGIGPKAALSILSTLSISDLTYAIVSGDVKAITKANGIGAKGANRVIMELKDKLDLEDVLNPTTTSVSGAVSISQSDHIADTVLALVSLGYSETDAMKAIKQVDDAQNMDSETLLKQALKKIF